MPTPTPPKVALSHMPAIGIRPVSGLRLSCIAPTEPFEVEVVSTAQSGPVVAPRRSSLPSRLPVVLGHRQLGEGRRRRALEGDRAA